MTRMVLSSRAYEQLASEAPEPERSRYLLLAVLKKVQAKTSLLAHRSVSAFKHERTRQRGTGEVRHVIHRADCTMKVLFRPGLPIVRRERVAALRGVWLCGHCKPELAAILAEHDAR